MKAVLAKYVELKLGLGSDLGMTEDLLHVHAGLIIFFLAALLLKRRMRSWIPIASVYFFAIANEIVDVFSPGSARNGFEPILDILNTIFWPTLLFLLARRRAWKSSLDKTI